jgi:hypothetical protein
MQINVDCSSEKLKKEPKYFKESSTLDFAWEPSIYHGKCK